ncbi:hypothetical protein SAMN05421544_10277 [Riemerella columbipharyngis]|uniref:Uncharacterized protein n=1 Tax=Riemerella columbipharyngis TaxID=1071918 RepID=A0A1G6ZG26_9FLAO|nr:hypothetical protein SAMN05421544_10277 [Riemerella columbipharyngis]
MRKIIISIFLSFVTKALFSQNVNKVGINTTDPKATLDIRIIDPSVENRAEGFLIPKLTGEELKLKDSQYLEAQDGTLIYATSGLEAEHRSSKTKYVGSPGVYYYDAPNEVWRKQIIGADDIFSSRKLIYKGRATRNKKLTIGILRFFIDDYGNTPQASTGTTVPNTNPVANIGFSQYWQGKNDGRSGFEYGYNKMRYSNSNNDVFMPPSRVVAGMASSELNVASLILDGSFYRVTYYRARDNGGSSQNRNKYILSAEKF